jgi:CRISPR-associated endonuclease Csn1
VGGLRQNSQSLVVSHKPDTGWQPALHNDTAYGAIKDAASNKPNVVVRRPLDTFVTWSPEDVKASVRDLMMGSRIAEAVTGGDATAKKAALANVTGSGGHTVRRVRTIERLHSVQSIADRRTGKPYKLVKRDGNHRAEIWRVPGGAMRMEVISTFVAAQDAEATRLGRAVPDHRPHPAAKLLMRLHKNDIVAVGRGEARRLLRLVKMRSGQITFAGNSEAGNLKTRDADRSDLFKYVHLSLSRMAPDLCRKVHVTPDGRVFDPGPPR